MLAGVYARRCSVHTTTPYCDSVRRYTGKDDVTGEDLVQRDDDQEATVLKRIATYHSQTKPLIEYYMKWAASGDRHAPQYVNIYGRGSVQHIRDKLFAALAPKHK